MTLLLVGITLPEKLTLLENNCYFEALFLIFSNLSYPDQTFMPLSLWTGRKISGLCEAVIFKQQCALAGRRANLECPGVHQAQQSQLGKSCFALHWCSLTLNTVCSFGCYNIRI